MKEKVGISVIIIIVIFFCIGTCHSCKKKSEPKPGNAASSHNSGSYGAQTQTQAVVASVKTMQQFEFPASGVLAMCLVSGADYYPIGKGGITIQYPDGEKTHLIFGTQTNMGYHPSGIRIITRDNPSVTGVQIWNYWSDSCP